MFFSGAGFIALALLFKNKHSADSYVLQFIDTNWTLEWLPTKLRKSVRFWPPLILKQSFALYVINK